jgi:hypothetical protein
MPVKHPFFICCCLLVASHQLLQKVFGISIDWADSHLDMIAGLPILLTLFLTERQLLFKKGPAYRLPSLYLVLITAYVVLMAEWLFPLLSHRFRADWKDVGFAFAGTLLFQLTINRPARNSRADKTGRPIEQ